MPIYEYLCTNCKHQFEELQTMGEPSLTTCPKCGKDTLKRLIGAGSGVIFKGSGFYLTDYKKAGKEKSSSNQETAKKEKSDSKSKEVKSEKKESKPEKDSK